MQWVNRYRTFFSWFSVVALIVLAFIMRWPDVALIKCHPLGDCGRDLLAGKHIADGTASIWTSPISALVGLPNTPQYYWLLALWYRVGGLLAISYFNLALGVLTVWFTYQLVLELTRNKTLSWFAGASIAILPYTINASVAIWQPHWQFFFGSCAMWLCLRAFRLQKPLWYYLAAASLWPLINQAYIALPFAAVMTFWLSVSWWQQFKKQKQPLQKFGLFVALALIWLVWLGMIFIETNPGSKAAMENLGELQTFNPAFIVAKLQDFFKILIHFFSDTERYLNFWSWLLSLPIVAAFYKWRTVDTAVEKTQLSFLLSLLVTLLLLVVDPGSTASEWHFMLQQYVFFLCIVLIPYFFDFPPLEIFIFSLSLFGLLLYQNRYMLDRSLRNAEPRFHIAELLAATIATDVRSQQLDPTQFRLIVKNKTPPEWMTDQSLNNDIETLVGTYESAGIQLALEQLDVRFADRVKIVPIDEWWANYIQPQAITQYVICLNFDAATAESCVDDLVAPGAQITGKTFLQAMSTSTPAMESIMVYRIRVQPILEEPQK